MGGTGTRPLRVDGGSCTVSREPGGGVHAHGRSRPDDPEHARAQLPGHRAYIEVSQLRAGPRARNGTLRSIETHTEAARRRVLLLSGWLRLLVVGLSLFLGFSGRSWATMCWLSESIQNQIETLAALTSHTQKARMTLPEVEARAWGATLPADHRGTLRGAAPNEHPPMTGPHPHSISVGNRARAHVQLSLDNADSTG